MQTLRKNVFEQPDEDVGELIDWVYNVCFSQGCDIRAILEILNSIAHFQNPNGSRFVPVFLVPPFFV